MEPINPFALQREPDATLVAKNVQPAKVMLGCPMLDIDQVLSHLHQRVVTCGRLYLSASVECQALTHV